MPSTVAQQRVMQAHEVNAHSQNRIGKCARHRMPRLEIESAKYLPEEMGMQNAHERFGIVEFTKRVKDTTTRVRVYMDRLIMEVGKEEHRSAGVHLLSVMGSDAEIAALWAGVTERAFFQIQIPGARYSQVL